MTYTIITRHGSRFAVNHGGVSSESCLPIAKRVYETLIKDGYRVYLGDAKRMFQFCDGEHIEDVMFIVGDNWIGASHNDLLRQRDDLGDHNAELWEMVEAGQGRIAELEERNARLEKENKRMQRYLSMLGQTAVTVYTGLNNEANNNNHRKNINS